MRRNTEKPVDLETLSGEGGFENCMALAREICVNADGTFKPGKEEKYKEMRAICEAAYKGE